ncbi:MAG: phage portal protein [Bacteroidales bacterium]|nr:phage portal protein [Bacteroidales bacterium]
MSYTIDTMTPDKIRVKESFKRLIPPALTGPGLSQTPRGNINARANYGVDPLQYELRTQSDFLREYDVNAHLINSMKYYPNPFSKDSDGKVYQKIKSRVAVGFQSRIHTKRLTALIGNNVSHRLIRSFKDSEAAQNWLADFREGWEEKNVEVAIHDAISADGKTGDCAICFFLSKNKVGWRTFSYENGDILYPHYDRLTGELTLFAREYTEEESDGEQITFLDVWDDTSYIRYKKSLKDNKKEWEIDEQKRSHNFPMCPVAYHRYGEPFWTPSQSLIENYELSLSQFAENNAAYALRILYTIGEEMEVISSLDGTPQRIDSSDPNAKIGFLEPADAAKSFETQLNKLEQNIMRSSFAVETPEIKSGSDMSSLTVKMLFADSYLKALDDAMRYQIFLDRATALFKYGYGVEVKHRSDYNKFRIKAELLPFVFMSESETVAALVQLVGSGVLSKQTASEIAYNSGYGTADEWNRILDEAHAEMVAEARANTTSRQPNVVSQTRQNQ